MRTLSFDIETYGFFRRGHERPVLPTQTVFHPRRSMYIDKCPRSELVQLIAVTDVDPNDWTPRTTRVFNPSQPLHLHWLGRWLDEADTLIGHNIAFDLMYCREAFPRSLMPRLSGRHRLIDTSVLSFLDNELDQSRSLKVLGPLHDLFAYEEDEANRTARYDSALDERAIHYAAKDTHNTAKLAAHLKPRITPRITDFCLDFYSDSIWTVIRMQEAGIPMTLDGLREEAFALARQIDALDRDLEQCGLVVGGLGSKKSQSDLINRLLDDVDKPTLARLFNTTNVYDLSRPDNPEKGLLRLTAKTKEVSSAVQNRKLLRHLLPADHSARPLLDKWDERTRLSKLLTSFVQPLISGRSSAKQPLATTIQPTSNGLGLGFPTIYIVPSKVDDSADDWGGQKQVRKSFKDPAAQTFPKPIQKLVVSRFGDEGTILKADFSQLEYRLAGVFSGEPVIIKGYNEGIDLHERQALLIFGRPHFDAKYADILPPTRYIRKQNAGFDAFEGTVGKMTNFAKLYWSGAATMQSQILNKGGIIVPFDVLQRAVDLRPEAEPVLYEWQCRLVEAASREQEIVLPLTGHRRRFLLGGHKPNEMVNFPIQTAGAITTARLEAYLHRHMPALDDPSPPMYLFQNTHDAVILDVRLTHLDDAKALLKSASDYVANHDYWAMLCDYTGHHVPLVLDIG